MKYFIILICALVTHNLQACDNNRLSLSIGSYHITTDYKPKNIDNYNQSNYGLSFECGISEHLYIDAGIYKNSLYKTSLHTGIILHNNINDIEYGSTIGIVSGYNKPIIYVRPYMQYKNIRVGYIPRIESLKVDRVLTFEIILEL